MQGVFNILATPFDDAGRVDVGSLRSLVQWEMAAGVHGFTVLGIMGEVGKLSDDERELVVRTVLEEVSGRLPVVVNATHTGTRHVCELAEAAAGLGAAAVMVAPPANLRNLDSLKAFYQAVIASVPIPIVVQDEPITTGVVMPPSFLASVGAPFIKLEEAPVGPKLSRILEWNPDIGVFGGLGGQYFIYELERGAVGTMTGFAFPEVLVDIYQDFIAGRIDQARRTFYRYMPLVSYEGQSGVGLAIRKEILRRRGAIRSSPIRLPGTILDDAGQDEIGRLLQWLDQDSTAPRE